jgi:hypothetical protein
MIIGQDIMRKLGLNLNFYGKTPVITWNELSVPMVKHGFWTHDRIEDEKGHLEVTGIWHPGLGRTS